MKKYTLMIMPDLTVYEVNITPSTLYLTEELVLGTDENTIKLARLAQTEDEALNKLKETYFKVERMEAKFDKIICHNPKMHRDYLKVEKMFGSGHLRTSSDFKDENALKFISNKEVVCPIFNHVNYQMLMKNSDKYMPTYFLDKKIANLSINEAVRAYLRFYVNKHDKLMNDSYAEVNN